MIIHENFLKHTIVFLFEDIDLFEVRIFHEF